MVFVVHILLGCITRWLLTTTSDGDGDGGNDGDDDASTTSSRPIHQSQLQVPARSIPFQRAVLLSDLLLS